MARKGVFLLIGTFVFLILLFGVVSAYCGGNYTSGEWRINSTITCSNELINITGNVTIADDTLFYPVTYFTALGTASYDLRNNQTSL